MSEATHLTHLPHRPGGAGLRQVDRGSAALEADGLAVRRQRRAHSRLPRVGRRRRSSGPMAPILRSTPPSSSPPLTTVPALPPPVIVGVAGFVVMEARPPDGGCAMREPWSGFGPGRRRSTSGSAAAGVARPAADLARMGSDRGQGADADLCRRGRPDHRRGSDATARTSPRRSSASSASPRTDRRGPSGRSGGGCGDLAVRRVVERAVKIERVVTQPTTPAQRDPGGASRPVPRRPVRAQRSGDGPARGPRPCRALRADPARAATRRPGAGPCREALPHRVRWSRMVILAALTPSAPQCRSMARRTVSRPARAAMPRGPPRRGGGRRGASRMAVRPRGRPRYGSRSSDATLGRSMRSRCIRPGSETSPRCATRRARRGPRAPPLPVEMPAEPWLTITKERLDQRFGSRPAPAIRARDGDHDAFRGIDDDAHRPCLR